MENQFWTDYLALIPTADPHDIWIPIQGMKKLHMTCVADFGQNVLWFPVRGIFSFWGELF